MSHGDPRDRHSTLFHSVRDGVGHGQQSLSGSSGRTASTSHGSVKTITGIKRTTAADLLKTVYNEASDSDSSLNDIGQPKNRKATRSQPSLSQLGYIPEATKDTGFYQSS